MPLNQCLNATTDSLSWLACHSHLCRRLFSHRIRVHHSCEVVDVDLHQRTLQLSVQESLAGAHAAFCVCLRLQRVSAFVCVTIQVSVYYLDICVLSLYYLCTI